MPQKRIARLILFLKYPEPGRVKTRLIPALGQAVACQFYEHMTAQTLNAARQSRISSVLYMDRPARIPDLRWLFGGRFLWKSQARGDLGRRLSRAFRGEFLSGALRCVVIGTDCPELGAKDLLKAFHALDRSDAVIGPSADGGYYLLGLRKTAFCAAGVQGEVLFRDMPWSSPRVYSQTVRRLKHLKLRVCKLRTKRDLDTVHGFTSEILKELF